MRGKAADYAYHGRSPGITPAYAGKRLSLLVFRVFIRDHPRLCGEKLSAFCWH